MIKIINPVPVFDDNHNVIKFKYNDGLVIHDCLTNTLNISYILIYFLISKYKCVDDILIELKKYFNIFIDVKCDDAFFFINFINDLHVKVNEEKFPNRIFWSSINGYILLEYDKYRNGFYVSDKLCSSSEPRYKYDLTLMLDILNNHFGFHANRIGTLSPSDELTLNSLL